MKPTRYLISLLFLLMWIGLGLYARSADRVRAGQWVGTMIVGGTTHETSSCLSQSDAAAMNGDAPAVKAYLETIIPPQICAITEVKADGNQIIYTASCRGGGGVNTTKTVTTTYFGDRSEGTDSLGGKTQARLVGACK
jgi:hypothetical protein